MLILPVVVPVGYSEPGAIRGLYSIGELGWGSWVSLAWGLGSLGVGRISNVEFAPHLTGWSSRNSLPVIAPSG